MKRLQHGVMRNPKMILAENLPHTHEALVCPPTDQYRLLGKFAVKFCDKINVFHFARGQEFCNSCPKKYD